jgi:O-antigen/teichoic acid export membrane protein
MNYLSETESTIKDIFSRIKNRDFSGNTGLVVKNSVYNSLRTFTAKAGSLIFTIILARLFMPELFGLYSLALSTIVIFTAMSELGVNQALVRFISRSIGKKKNNVKEYIIYFGKIKLILVSFSIFLLLVSSWFISEFYYHKPIFLALLAGAFYIAFIHFTSFIITLSNSFNNFKNAFFQEIIFQVSRIILVPLVVIYSLKISVSNNLVLFNVISLIALSYLISGIYMYFVSKRYFLSKINIKERKKKLSSKEKTEVNQFVILTAAIVLSGVFFGNIDKIMLGRFVSSEFIGYYQAAFSVIGALTSLGMFGAVLLPIFSRMKKKALMKATKNSLMIVFLISAGMFVLTFLFSSFIILIIFGKEYILSNNILRLFSLLILIVPITSVYLTYFMSKNKLKIIAKSLIISTIFNILLNYLLIISLLPYGEISAVYGVTIATIISQGIYLGILAWKRD